MAIEYLAGQRIRGTNAERTGLTTITAGSATDVTWGTVSGVTDNGSGAFTKSGSDAWGAGAITTETINTNGFFTAITTATHWTFSIDSSASTAQWAEIYEVHPTWSSTTNYWIYDSTSGTSVENNLSRVNSASEVLKIKINSSNYIEFYIDDVLKHTSDSPISSTMYGRAYNYTSGQTQMDYTPATVTNPNLQDGSIFEETDTNKHYIYTASTNTWTEV